jgi:molybdopterin molybdotransferase
MRKEGFGGLVSLSEALETLRAMAAPVGNEKVELDNALGRVLAEDIVSEISVPHFRKSAMDGFAVIASDTFGAGNTGPLKLTVVDSAMPGMASAREVKQGECIEIATGAPLPQGADSVLMVEYTEAKGEKLTVYKSVAPGENVVEIGSDMKKGTRVLKEGTRLNSMRTGVLASLGISSVSIRKRPVVGVLSSGNEVVSIGEPLSEGTIYNINSRTITDALLEQGCEVVDFGIARDRREELKSAISKGMEKCDFLLVSGGSSLGSEDLMKEVVSELGELLIHGIAVKPGKPTVVARIEGKLMIGLPGYPTSALSNFHILVLPVLDKMTGMRREERIVEANLTRKIVSSIGRYEFLPVKVEEKQGERLAVPVLRGSSAITTLATADGFVEISENTEVLKKDETVRVKLF